MKEYIPRTTIFRLSYAIPAFVVCLTLSIAHSGLVNAQQQNNNNTLMQSQGTPNVTFNRNHYASPFVLTSIVFIRLHISQCSGQQS
jgi:hypothetical protein